MKLEVTQRTGQFKNSAHRGSRICLEIRNSQIHLKHKQLRHAPFYELQGLAFL